MNKNSTSYAAAIAASIEALHGTLECALADTCIARQDCAAARYRAAIVALNATGDTLRHALALYHAIVALSHLKR